MRLGMVSLDQAWEDKNVNQDRCEEHAAQAAAAEVDILFFPEMTLTGYTTRSPALVEDASDSDSIKFFQQLARKHSIAIVAGVALRSGLSLFNTCQFISQQGTVLGDYSKINLFPLAEEDYLFSSGNRLSVVENGELRLGLSICFDLRFPGLYSAISPRANAAAVIASWPELRVGHWYTLLKARAIENQMFMVGVNRVGTDGNGISYANSSKVFAPDGTEVVSAYSWKYLSCHDVNLEEVNRQRSGFPVLVRTPDFSKMDQ